jgi:hypothetical protein
VPSERCPIEKQSIEHFVLRSRRTTSLDITHPSTILCVACCHIEALRRADHSSSGALPTLRVGGRCVLSGYLVNKEPIARAGLQCQRNNNNNNKVCMIRIVQMSPRYCTLNKTA